MLLSLLCLCLIEVNGQEMLAEKTKKMQSKTLLIVMEDATTLPAYNRYKNDPEKKEAFVERITYQNSMLKYGFDTYWTFCKVDYKPLKEAFAMMKKEPNLYCVTMLAKYIEMDNEKLFYSGGSTKTRPASTEAYLRKREITNETLELRMYDPGMMFITGIPSLIPTKGDITFGVLHLQSSLVDRLETTYSTSFSKKELEKLTEDYKIKNAEYFRNLTLLIDKNDLNPALTPELIKTIYKYPFKIVGYNEIENAILSKNDSIAYLSILTLRMGEGKMHYQMFTRTSDGKVLYSLAPQGKLITSFGEKYSALEEKYLRELAEYIEK